MNFVEHELPKGTMERRKKKEKLVYFSGSLLDFLFACLKNLLH